MNAEIYAVGNEVIGAIAGGIIQGLAVFALVWVVLKFFRRATAATRHAVWLTTLLIVAALPFANLLPLLKLNSPAAPAISEHEIFEPEFAGPLPEPVSAAQAEPDPERNSKQHWEVSAPAQLGIALLVVWTVLALIRIVGLGRQLLLLRRIKTGAMPAAPLLMGAFSETAADLSINRNAQLLVSREIAAPMAVGFFKPAVLLPHAVATQSTDAQIGYVLRHELAHLARCDDWANLIQQFVTALFFFHPGILFLSRRLTREREIACDDHALAALKAPREYALFLTEFASRMKGRDFTAAPAAWSSNSQLKERIGMILDKKRNASPRTSRAGVSAMAAATFLLAAAAFVGAPRLVFAAEKPEAPPAPAAIPAIPAPPTVSVEPVVAVDPSDIQVAISTKPALASIVHVHPTAAPHPIPAPAPKMVAHADLPDGPPRPRGPRDGDLERRLERVERMLESMVGRDKEKDKEKIRAGAQTFEFHGMPKEDWSKMQREIERATRDATRDAERASKDIEKIKRQAMEATQDAEDHGHRMAARQALKAQRQALESQRRSLEKQIHEIERQIEREDQAVERARESVERQKERFEEEKERAENEKERAKERAKKDKEKEKDKRRDNESNSSASSISNSSNASNNSNNDNDEKLKK